ncbi:HTH-type transcriptional regulator PgrR [BD1-7 clade bacterium]|uniref:HTH-type transcriptional regulator PgrR n=1 Tax=BD1-7 clade bacterium TaxID=2029982 RepID=A0A5S9P432_9GAMM|nr:HTH-type transcriptional regulator PgrR [BD1-7 clade bacterium]CAA0097944.1 HTH-type transcriptional regulator PgrR [BD1-7 clade bacterium]
MKDYLRHMMLFRVLVESGSLTAAAEQLSLSKSVLSQHLKALEVGLGVELLHRTTRRQSLTPAGRDFYQACCDIEFKASQAWQQAQASQDHLSGSIRITAPHALMNPIVAPAMIELTKNNLDIVPELIAEDRQVDLIAANIDLAIRVGRMPDSNLKQRKIGEFNETLVTSSTINKELDVTNASDMRYIANEWEAPNVHHTLHHRDGRQKTWRFKRTIKANNIETVMLMVKQGLGTACVPEFLCGPNSGLTALVEGFRKIDVSVYAVHAYQSGRAPALVDAAIEIISSNMQQINSALPDDVG